MNTKTTAANLASDAVDPQVAAQAVAAAAAASLISPAVNGFRIPVTMFKADDEIVVLNRAGEAQVLKADTIVTSIWRKGWFRYGSVAVSLLTGAGAGYMAGAKYGYGQGSEDSTSAAAPVEMT